LRFDRLDDVISVVVLVQVEDDVRLRDAAEDDQGDAGVSKANSQLVEQLLGHYDVLLVDGLRRRRVVQHDHQILLAS
jgi:hypothetical protein